MKCPFCGEEMRQGKLRTRGENYFVPDSCKTPVLYTKKSIKKAYKKRVNLIVKQQFPILIGRQNRCNLVYYRC